MSEIVFAAERLLPAAGGAERFMLEALGQFGAAGHGVRAIWVAGEPTGGALAVLPTGVEGQGLPAPPATPYWEQRRLRRELVGAGLEQLLGERRADVVITQLHAAPAAIAAGAAHGCRTILLLPSYESFCKLAFDAASPCVPELGCESCPGGAGLDPRERAEIARSRAAHAAALAAADALIAPSKYVAAACETWCGRRPEVIRPVFERTAAAVEPAHDGPLVLAATSWSVNKGSALIVPLVEALDERPFRITRAGLDQEQVQALTATGRVELASPSPIEELLAGAAALLVPSQWPEPFGRVAFEAASAGVPVIASSLGGLSEVVSKQELVLKADDPEAWLAALMRLTDPEWAAASLRARKHVGKLLAEAAITLPEMIIAR